MIKTHICIKYIVVGDAGTGKTCLLNHFFNDAPLYRTGGDYEVPLPTQGMSYLHKRILTQRYGTIDCQLWDTSGMEKYNSISLTQTFYRGAEGVLVVFDVTSRASFDNVVHVWLPRLRQTHTMHEKCRYIMVGNKIDLVHVRKVSTEEGVAVAHKYNMDYIEVSSYHSDTNQIRMPFIILATQLIDHNVCRITEYVEPDDETNKGKKEEQCCGGQS